MLTKTDKILFVDDEPAVLDGYQRILRKDFSVDVAASGEQGLTAIQNRGPYSVVVSDMRMPGMNGAQFLANVRQQAPDTVRILLTGYTDLSAAIDSVNEGNIFRFLTKPCEKDALAKTIAVGVKQYHLLTAERELLEETLLGTITVLTEVLSAASPLAFGRSMRITRCVRHLAFKFALSSPWRFEVASTLSQLGCVSLDSLLVKRAYEGAELSSEDQARFDNHPHIAMDLLSLIPRLEPIAWMISQQLNDNIPDMVPGVPPNSGAEIVLGAKILKLALAFDLLRMQCRTLEEAIALLHLRDHEFGASLIDCLADFKLETNNMSSRKVLSIELAAGMILEQDVQDRRGELVASNGQEISPALLVKLLNSARDGQLDEEITALVPV